MGSYLTCMKRWGIRQLGGKYWEGGSWTSGPPFQPKEVNKEGEQSSGYVIGYEHAGVTIVSQI